MDRRHFLGLTALAGLTAGVSPALRRRLFAQSMPVGDPLEPYTGPFYIFVNAGGGWDPTMLTDPKGGPINNQFAATEIRTAGAIRYAPITYTNVTYSNQQFFDKFQSRLLVLNGVDMSTNNHDTGNRFTWSGRLENGYPPLAALIAAGRAPGKPLAFLSNGGYENTQGISPLTRLSSVDAIARIAYPNRPDPANMNSRYFSDATYQRIVSAQRERLSNQISQQTLPVYHDSMQQLLSTRGGANLLERVMQFLPPAAELTAARTTPVYYQGLIGLAAYRAGITAAINLSVGGFDTHGDHDNAQANALGPLLLGVDRLMDKIDMLGLQDRVIVMMGSDFGRTPMYNAQRGKDHWSVTSMYFMGAGIRGGRVLGESDDRQRARGIDPASLTVSDSSMVKLNPRSIHLALRRLAGIDTAPLARQFPISGEEMNLFA